MLPRPRPCGPAVALTDRLRRVPVKRATTRMPMSFRLGETAGTAFQAPRQFRHGHLGRRGPDGTGPGRHELKFLRGLRRENRDRVQIGHNTRCIRVIFRSCGSNISHRCHAAAGGSACSDGVSVRSDGPTREEGSCRETPGGSYLGTRATRQRCPESAGGHCAAP
jgi:hypothetical protein